MKFRLIASIIVTVILIVVFVLFASKPNTDESAENQTEQTQ